MLNSLRKAGMTAPKFDDRISMFVVTFPNHSLLSDETVTWISGLHEDGLTDSQCMALASLRAGGELDNAIYRKATGLDSRVATSELRDLVGRGLVEQVGTRRWTWYRLAASLRGGRDAPTQRMSPADRRTEVLNAFAGETSSRAELAARSGLPDATVRRWLSVLRKEGLVEIAGTTRTGRGVKYRRVTEPT